MNKKTNPISKICSALIIFIVILTSIAIFKAFQDAGRKERSLDYEDFGSGWLSEDNKDVVLDDLPGSCVVHKTIPSLDSDQKLVFQAKNMNVDVYVDDICVYRTEEVKEPFFKALYGETVGSAFIEVDILDEYSGKTLYLDIQNPYNKVNGCRIASIFLGDGANILRHNAILEVETFCFSILVLFIGLVCLVFYVPMKRKGMIDSSLYYLGITAFTFGMSMITDSKFLPLLIGYDTLFYTISLFYMAIMPIPLLLFFEQLFDNLNKKIIGGLCIFNIIGFFFMLILNACGIMDYHDNVFIVLAIFTVSLLYMGYVTVQRMIRREKGHTYHNIGVLLIVLTVSIDLLIIYNNPSIGNYIFSMFGIAGFTCMEFAQVLWKHLGNYVDAMKTTLISRLAYYDGLTDLLNRTSYMEAMEKLEKEEHSRILFAMFDVNDLKYVNDNFGHADGDTLIISVAESLRKSFETLGDCYRIGGDEFVLISKCENPEKKFEDARTVLNQLIQEQNEHSKYPVSVAVGYAVMSDEFASLDDLMKEADRRMYEDKKRIKAQWAPR